MTSEKFQTHWYVITGAPCSGKTAVVCELERRGRRVVHEAARALIDARLAGGHTLADIKADEHRFETAILQAKLKIEATLPFDQLIFLDRGVPDSIAYFTAAGLDPAAAVAASRRKCYAGVFIFERLAFERDPVRSEDGAAAALLERLLKESYRKLGYRPTWVPVMTVAERTEWVLQRACAAFG